ncbi:hypothetical protein [Zhihengliuella salsuginis]|uniref:Lipoprotein n=1 Tax=Zhihengliuella salsuginis TaxID=578222 RepID=A0ABQ3GBX7_9MICC|nr:hypothetical protein [Zhihengliuella salsuginis]GHD00267.1 hypothetical protein GCM10008096_03340 [Zhihengliuella salsuginis]
MNNRRTPYAGDMRRARQAATLVLLTAAVLTGCADPGNELPGGTVNAEAEPTLEELRRDAADVAVSFLPLLPGSPTEEELRDRVATKEPSACDNESYRIRLPLGGDGIDDPERFVDEALTIIHELGFSTEDYRRNSQGSDHVNVSGRLPDGRVIALEASPSLTRLHYQTVCSKHESLARAFDAGLEETLDEATESLGKPEPERPSRWGVRG